MVKGSALTFPVVRRPHEVHFPPCGVYVIESHHSDDFRMEVTGHPFAKLLYAFEGRGRIVAGAKSHALHAGWMAVVPAGLRHRLVDEEPLALYVVCVRRDALAFGESECRSAAQPGLRELAERLLREMLYEQTTRHPGWEIILTGLAGQLYGGWLRWQAGHRKRFGPGTSRQRVEACLEEYSRTFYHRDSLGNAAKRCGLGIRRFTQIFRELSGTSWLSFVRTKRIDHARHLLKTTRRSVTSVCFECGFEDLSTFYRAFHQMEQASPQRWRERQGGAEALRRS